MMPGFAQVIERYADRTPTAPAVAFEHERLTYAELAERSRAAASALRDCGVASASIVALLMQNCLEFLEASIAVSRLGAIALPLNFRLARSEWQYILEHAGATHLIVGDNYVADGLALRESIAGLGTMLANTSVEDDIDSFRTLCDEHRGRDTPLVATNENDIHRLMYTSGTTSRPKGVPITYGNVAWKVMSHVIELGLSAQDRTLMAGPMYHVGAYDLPGVGMFHVGGSLAILPRFDPDDVLRAVERERATITWLAPSMVNAVLQRADAGSYDTSSMRLVINGGEKMPGVLVRQLQDVFPNAWLADAYGLTETVSGDTFLPADETFRKLGSVGKPVIHLDLKIVDEAGAEVAAAAKGEIVLRGPKVVSSYWRDPEATSRSFDDGWFHTGDVGHVDVDGFLYIDDRKKDMIVSGGENIASPEIERVLYEHAAVLEAAVVPRPDARWGEVPHAVVVLKSDRTASPDELLAHCAEHLARFKVPKTLEFVEELPRNASGKILKRVLRERLLGD